jgi:drug/metabolite transporter (DMT)-like permease
MFIGTLCWVIYTLTASAFPDWSTIRYTTLSMVMGTLIIGAIATIINFSGGVPIPTFTAMWSAKYQFLYLIIIAGITAIFSWNNGIKKLGSSNGILFINLIPLIAIVTGFIRGSNFSKIEILGTVVTLSALIVHNIHDRYFPSKLESILK